MSTCLVGDTMHDRQDAVHIQPQFMAVADAHRQHQLRFCTTSQKPLSILLRQTMPCLLIACQGCKRTSPCRGLTSRYGTILCSLVSSSHCIAACVRSVIAAILLSCMRTPRSNVHSSTATRIMLSPMSRGVAVPCIAPRGVWMAACTPQLVSHLSKGL